MIERSFANVHAKLVQAFNVKLSNGSVYRAGIDIQTGAVMANMMPFLSFRTGTITTADWTAPFEQEVKWDIPCDLLVAGRAREAGAGMRKAVGEVFAILSLVRGLPVDEDGVLTPYSEKAARLSTTGGLDFLANRGGPVLRSISVSPEWHENPYSVATCLFHVEFIADFTPEGEYPRVKEVQLGMITGDYAGVNLRIDEQLPFVDQIPVPAPAADTVTIGGFAGPQHNYSTTMGPGASTIQTQKFPAVAGIDPSKVVASMQVTPATAAIATSATRKLEAIAHYLDGSVLNVSNGTTWGTSSGSIATVSATGLVTGVGAGSATITATFGGSSATATVTVS